MKVTRYPQSCLLLEKDDRKIVIDPGTPFTETHQPQELDGVEAVLFTHQHPDHLDAAVVDYLSGHQVEVICNQATAKVIGERELRIVDDGEQFEVAGFNITARELPHCVMVDGSPGPQNTGYVIDGALFHPGDGFSIENLSVTTLAVPIQGPSLSFRDAYEFALQVSAKTVVPIHFDAMGAKPEMFAHFTAKAPFEVRLLADGESTEL